MPDADLQAALRRLNFRGAADVSKVLARVTGAVQAREALGEILPSIVEQYGAAAGTMAAQWYDEQRIKQNVRGKYRAAPANLGSSGADALVGYGTQPLVGEQPNFPLARTLIVGGLTRRIANFARETVMQSSLDDPQSTGWQREGSGECGFCAMLIGRGAVYSEAGADFASHDHCNCYATPAFEGKAKPVRPFTPSARQASDADRARVRDYLATH